MSNTPLRRRGAALAAALLSASLVLTACGGDGDDTGDKAAGTRSDKAAETRSVKADNGTIEVPADPQRVVTIGNTNLPFIDLGGKPVGVTEASDSELGVLPEEQQADVRGSHDPRRQRRRGRPREARQPQAGPHPGPVPR